MDYGLLGLLPTAHMLVTQTMVSGEISGLAMIQFQLMECAMEVAYKGVDFNVSCFLLGFQSELACWELFLTLQEIHVLDLLIVTLLMQQF